MHLKLGDRGAPGAGDVVIDVEELQAGGEAFVKGKLKGFYLNSQLQPLGEAYLGCLIDAGLDGGAAFGSREGAGQCLLLCLVLLFHLRERFLCFLERRVADDGFGLCILANQVGAIVPQPI